MTSNRLKDERARWERRGRAKALPIAWVLSALFGLLALTETYRAISLAAQWQINLSEALELIRLFDSPPMERTFSGYEIGLIERSLSAIVDFAFCGLMIIGGLSYRARVRSEARIWSYIDELEKRASQP